MPSAKSSDLVEDGASLATAGWHLARTGQKLQMVYAFASCLLEAWTYRQTMRQTIEGNVQLNG